MTNIYIANLISNITSEQIDILKYYFNDGVIKRIEKSPSEAYKLKRITSRLMFVQVFKDLGINTNKLKNIYYNNHGKLIFPDEDLNISLSYSVNKVVFLISDDKVGMDVEHIKQAPKAFCISLLEKMTQQTIHNNLAFYYLWTQIESIVKIYDDKGLKDIFYGELFAQKHYTNQILYNEEYLISTSSINEIEFTEPIKTINV